MEKRRNSDQRSGDRREHQYESHPGWDGVDRRGGDRRKQQSKSNPGFNP